MTAPLSPVTPGASLHEWFSKSGYQPLTYETGYREYAKRLSHYISDPSTVRARTIEQYGKAPTIDEIVEMRAKWVGKVARRGEGGYKYGRHKDPKYLTAPAVVEPEPEPEVVAALALAEPEPEPEPVIVEEVPYGPMLTSADVIDACARITGCTYGEIIGTMRFKPIVEARMLCCAIMRARGGSYPNVARRIGGRDHSTVIHAVRTFFNRVILRPEMLDAWVKLAPDGFKHCRTIEEFEAMGRRAAA